jgi:hypothetical protein
VEEFKSILLSVFAGVITTISLYAASLFLKNVISPWYQRLIYKGVDVSGQWEGNHDYNEDLSFTATLNLEQNAHDISGTLTIIKLRNGEQERITNMNVSGEVWEGFISLKCRTISRKHLSFGSILCKIIDSTLDGEYIFRNLAGNGSEISTVSLSLSRKNA